MSQHKPWVISHQRTDTPNVWLNTSTTDLSETITVLDNGVKLADMCRQFTFA